MPVSSNVAQVQQVAINNPDEALAMISMLDRNMLGRDDRAAFKNINRDINPVVPQVRRRVQSQLMPVGVLSLGGHVPITEQKNMIQGESQLRRRNHAHASFSSHAEIKFELMPLQQKNPRQFVQPMHYQFQNYHLQL